MDPEATLDQFNNIGADITKQQLLEQLEQRKIQLALL
jgi:hypothetical protein